MPGGVTVPHVTGDSRPTLMKKIFTLMGSTVGGSLGWAAGATIGTMTAFFLMVIGTAAGTYAGIKAAERYLP